MGEGVLAIGICGWRTLGKGQRRQASKKAIHSDRGGTSSNFMAWAWQGTVFLSSVVTWEKALLNDWPQWDYF